MGESDLDSMYTNCPIKIGLCILEVGKQRNPEANSACDADMVVESARGKRGGGGIDCQYIIYLKLFFEVAQRIAKEGEDIPAFESFKFTLVYPSETGISKSTYECVLGNTIPNRCWFEIANTAPQAKRMTWSA